MSEDADAAVDRELLARAELALTQLNNRYGLEPPQSATLTAIRLRLEGKSRASLDDLLVAAEQPGVHPIVRHAVVERGDELRRMLAARR